MLREEQAMADVDRHVFAEVVATARVYPDWTHTQPSGR